MSKKLYICIVNDSMTIEDAKKLEGYYNPDFNVGDEVIFITPNHKTIHKDLFGSIGFIVNYKPILADEEHFWHWDFDIEWTNKGLLKGCSPWHIELTDRQKREKSINKIIV